jgi:hypothetical protein
MIVDAGGGANAPASFGPLWAEFQKAGRTAALAA